MADDKKIIIKGAREHNLKNIDLEIHKNSITCFTGVSGSGKSSLVFDTIYAEGQRRYMESLSSYARQFLERMNRPDVDSITGIAPSIAIEQKPPAKNPRSTVGTTTELYDYLRLLFARIGKTYCSNCGKLVLRDSVATVVEKLKTFDEGKRLLITFKVHKHEKRKLQEEFNLLLKKGFFRIYTHKEIYDLNETQNIKTKIEDVYVIVDRISIDKTNIETKYSDSLEVAFREGEGRIFLIEADTNIIHPFSKYFECCGIVYEQPEPTLFSFNTPHGACPECQGFGRKVGIDYDLVIPDKYKTIRDGAIVPFTTKTYSRHWRELIRVASDVGLRVNVPIKDLTEAEMRIVKNGTRGYIGIKPFFEELEKETYKIQNRVFLSRFRGYTKCEACNGSRLRREALNIKIADKNIADIITLSLKEFYDFFSNLKLSEYDYKIAERILKELIKRSGFLVSLGVGYLTIDRIASTLSGGETQRINLGTSLGSALVGTLYILDEPSIGLHPRDTDRMIKVLKSLKDLGNTVLIVEHDPEMIRSADYIVDIGPKAGVEGGKIVFNGTYEELLAYPNSLTGEYLSGKKKIEIPEKRKKPDGRWLKLYGARENNLKNIDVEIPLGLFVCITGVSGSGKSTLINDILYPAIYKQKTGENIPVGKYNYLDGSGYFQHVEMVDQSPIGKTSRSNPATYIKVFDLIREFFSELANAKKRNLTPGFFSFNVPGGRCETCQGEGYVKIEMQFLADLYLLCEDCKGSRYRKEVHDITYRGKSIVDVLNMTVDEAIIFFSEQKRIVNKLESLRDVGLGYIKLGQPSNTLSGGEAQRIKLAEKLSPSERTDSTLFIFDEPTTGLHFDDIKKLLNCFNLLIKNGHSLIVIEHNLEVIKCADYIIDLGPEAGKEGGEIIGFGTPEELINNPRSYTGKYLAKVLKS